MSCLHEFSMSIQWNKTGKIHRKWYKFELFEICACKCSRLVQTCRVACSAICSKVRITDLRSQVKQFITQTEYFVRKKADKSAKQQVIHQKQDSRESKTSKLHSLKSSNTRPTVSERSQLLIRTVICFRWCQLAETAQPLPSHQPSPSHQAIPRQPLRIWCSQNNMMSVQKTGTRSREPDYRLTDQTTEGFNVSYRYLYIY